MTGSELELKELTIKTTISEYPSVDDDVVVVTGSPVPSSILIKCTADKMTLRSPVFIMNTGNEMPIRCKTLEIINPQGDEWQSLFPQFHALQDLTIKVIDTVQ